MRPRRNWLILLPPPVDAEALTAAGRWHRLRTAAFAPTAANSTTVRFDRGMDLVVDDGVLLVAGRRK